MFEAETCLRAACLKAASTVLGLHDRVRMHHGSNEDFIMSPLILIVNLVIKCLIHVPDTCSM